MDTLLEVKPVSLREQIVIAVRAAIIQGRLRPGDRVVEAQLTKQLGVSRTPVREALILLEREGLVESSPHRGTCVRRYTAADVSAVFSMRTALENLSAEHFMPRVGDKDIVQLEAFVAEHKQHISRGRLEALRDADMAFHSYLIQCSQHPLAVRYWSELAAQLAALLYLRAEAFPTYDETQITKDHESIVDAYRHKNLAAVEAHNERINTRVCRECQAALVQLGLAFEDDAAASVPKSVSAAVKGGL